MSQSGIHTTLNPIQLKPRFEGDSAPEQAGVKPVKNRGFWMNGIHVVSRAGGDEWAKIPGKSGIL